MLNVEAWDAPGTVPPATLPTSLLSPQTVITARYADRGFLTRSSDTPAHDLYEARLMSDVDIGQSVFDAIAVGNKVALTVSELEFWNGDDVFNAASAEGRVDGRMVRIRTSPVTNRAATDWGGSLAGATLVWQGTVSRIDALGLRARLALSDITDRFATPLQTTLYDGGGGLGGPPELKGRPKAISLGNRFNVTPVYLGLVDLGVGALPTYQTNWRTIVAHDAVRIRGVLQSFVGGLPGIGEVRDFPDVGCFQLGSTADGPVTCDVRGDAPGGSYAKTIPAALRVLLQALGPGLTDADFDSWTWFQIQPLLLAEIGWGIGADATTADAAVTELLSSCGAWLSGSRAGQVKIALLNAPAAVPDFVLTRGDVLDCQPAALPSDFQPTPQVVEVLAARNWTPLDDIAGSVAGTERAALISPGSFERALSSLIAARATRVRKLSLAGLYRYSADAQARAQELQVFLERGLRVFTVVTDRYLGQVELGMTGQITYPFFGLAGGWSGLVVGWRERIGARRLELTMIG